MMNDARAPRVRRLVRDETGMATHSVEEMME
jgi:hypothetical protein